jgi:hypothetical protein
MASVRDTGAIAKLRRVLEAVHDAAPEMLRDTGNAIAREASLRAPSPEEEYETMMYGAGNPYDISVVGSADSDLSQGDGRNRFIKEPEDYLQPFIAKNVEVDGLYVGVGDKEMLEVISHYRWRNLGGEYESNEGFWREWEFGTAGTFTIRPRFIGSLRGTSNRRYPLRPSLEVEKPPLFEMTKTIPRKRMYGGVDLDTQVEKVLIPAIKKAAQKAQ